MNNSSPLTTHISTNFNMHRKRSYLGCHDCPPTCLINIFPTLWMVEAMTMKPHQCPILLLLTSFCVMVMPVDMYFKYSPRFGEIVYCTCLPISSWILKNLRVLCIFMNEDLMSFSCRVIDMYKKGNREFKENQHNKTALEKREKVKHKDVKNKQLMHERKTVLKWKIVEYCSISQSIFVAVFC